MISIRNIICNCRTKKNRFLKKFSKYIFFMYYITCDTIPICLCKSCGSMF